MGMTMTQKILAAAAGLDKVEAGQLIEADLDLVLGNDITSPVAIHEMEKMTVNTVFDKLYYRILLYFYQSVFLSNFPMVLSTILNIWYSP